MGIVKVIQQGGIFMAPLLLMSVLALSVVMERIVFFVGRERGSDEFMARIREFIRQNRIDDARLWLDGLKGSVSAVAEAGLSQWGRGRDAMENTMAACSHLEFVRLNRYLVVLETIVTASPLIGLLGTITGMMGVFRAVAEKMATNPQADTSSILAGIGEALVATATGICLAVVCLFFHNVFAALAEGQMDSCQTVANEILGMSEASNGGK